MATTRSQTAWALSAGRLAALLAAGGLVEGWLLARSVVPAQDSVRFVAEAQTIERLGLASFVRGQSSSPLFPAAVATWHRLVRPWLGDSPQQWALAVQGVAAGGLVLSVLPLYGSTARLFGPRVGLATGLAYLVLPEVSRLGPDGLSDSLQMLLLASAWYCFTRVLSVHPVRPAEAGHLAPKTQPRHLGWLLAAGVAVGLALLARSEGLVWLVGGTVAIALGDFLSRSTEHGCGWTMRMARALAPISGAALVWGAYLAWIPATSPSDAAWRLLGRADAEPTLHDFAGPTTLVIGDVGPRLTEPTNQALAGGGDFSLKDSSRSLRFSGAGRSAIVLLVEWLRSLAFVWPWAVVPGLVCGLRRPELRPMAILTTVVTVLYLTAAGQSAWAHGYLTARHLAPLAGVLLGWGVWLVAPGQLPTASQTSTNLPASRGPSSSQRPWRRWSWTTALLRWSCAVAVLGCLATLARPSHASHGGHRQAAAWLARHSTPAERVLDTRGWTALYSGRETYRFDAARAALVDPRLGYLVCERAELDRPSRRGATLRRLATQALQPPARFSAGGPSEVLVFRCGPRAAELATTTGGPANPAPRGK